MKCYRCHGTLDTARNTCTKCGTDIRFFKKIVYMSNRYYNEGLVKAQARDLSGAREALKTSLNLYKENVQARNLLGLVDYAMGESAEALKEWVISKNHQPANNIADRYINNLRRNMRDLDSEDHGIRKYNQALNYARNGARDLATIQLKKVVSVHPNMVKAYELLALLYIEDGKFDQARRILNRCLEVDRGNSSAIRYLRELNEMNTAGGSRSIGVVGDDDREQVIVPVRFRDFGSYLANSMYILLGAVIGFLIAWFVIVPGRVEKQTADLQSEIMSYQGDLSSMRQENDDREMREQNEAASRSIEESIRESLEEASRIEESEKNSETPEESGHALPTEVAKAGSWSAYQDLVATCVAEVNTLKTDEAGDPVTDEAGNPVLEIPFPELIAHFFAIDPSQVSEGNKEHYTNIARTVTGTYDMMMRDAKALADEGSYERAAAFYDAAAYVFKDRAAPVLEAGICYEAAGDRLRAADRYWLVYNVYPDQEEAVRAADRYKSLTGEESIPGLPEGTDIAALRRPITFDYLMSQMNLEPAAETPAAAPENEPENEQENAPEQQE